MDTTSEGFEAVSCPECGSPLVQGNAPFYLHGEYVGTFESLICKNSHFSALTESGYKDATRIAEQLGLIGPASEEDGRMEGIKRMEGFVYKLHSIDWRNCNITRFLVHQILSQAVVLH
jgi:hypothetical protein